MLIYLVVIHVINCFQIFSEWLDRAVDSLPVVRADGLIQASKDQLDEFKASVKM